MMIELLKISLKPEMLKRISKKLCHKEKTLAVAGRTFCHVIFREISVNLKKTYKRFGLGYWRIHKNGSQMHWT